MEEKVVWAEALQPANGDYQGNLLGGYLAGGRKCIGDRQQEQKQSLAGSLAVFRGPRSEQ